MQNYLFLPNVIFVDELPQSKINDSIKVVSTPQF